MQRGFFVNRRNAHQSRNGQIQRAATFDKSICIFGHDACFLRLFACINLNEQLGARACFLCKPRAGLGKLRAVNCMNRLEKFECLPCFVGLQRADQMQINVRERFAKCWPFTCRLLNTVFTETPMTLGQYCLHPRVWLHFGHCYQVHGTGLSPGCRYGLGDAIPDVFQTHTTVSCLHGLT